MALPKIAVPTFKLILPSNKKEISFRSLLVKEEKILLMAVEAGDELSMITAVKDVCAACIVSEKIDTNKLPYFDLEYIFLNIRAKSIGEVISLEYRHTDGVNYKGEPCDQVTKIDLNLEKVNITILPEHTAKIKIDDSMFVEMSYPTIETIRQATESTNQLELIARSLKCVYVGDSVHDPDNLQDSIEFLESLNSNQFENISKFFETMPKLRHELNYKCEKCGQEDTIKLEGLTDFF
jgi:hypothetical protein